MNRRDLLQSAVVWSVGIGTQEDRPRKPWRVAVIGRTGRGDYGHDLDNVWLDLPNGEIVAVADENPEGRTRAKERLKAPAAYADYREMLRKEKPELVSVAPRWLDCHLEMTLACAEAGVRGVLLEKPLCRTLQEADAMVAASERTGMKIAVCHQARYSPRIKTAQALLAEGRLGDLLELRARGKEDARGGGEDLMVLGTHLLDLMRLFAGDPQWCFARVTEGGKLVTRSQVREGAEGIGPLAGDAVTAVYGFASQGPRQPVAPTGYFASHRARQGAGTRFALHLIGSKGQLIVKTDRTPVFLLEDPTGSPGQSGKAWQAFPSGKEAEGEPTYTLRSGNGLAVRDLMRCIEQGGQPRSSVYDGRAALEMILAVYESHRQNAPVSFPLRNRLHPLSTW